MLFRSSGTVTGTAPRSGKLPPVERWLDSSGDIPVPVNARGQGTYHTSNAFGVYRYASYILEKNAFADDI